MKRFGGLKNSPYLCIVKTNNIKNKHYENKD